MKGLAGTYPGNVHASTDALLDARRVDPESPKPKHTPAKQTFPDSENCKLNSKAVRRRDEAR